MWREKYEQLMFGENRTIETMSVAAEMKYQHMPDVLFKYRCVSSNTLNALRNDILYSSPPKVFNDMFEGSIELCGTSILQNIYQKTYNKLQQQYHFLPKDNVFSYEEMISSIADVFGVSYDNIISDMALFPLLKSLNKLADDTISCDITRLQEYARNAYNICCLCAENNNHLMWVHYADQHKGFCIGYEIKKQQSNLTHLTFPVIYRSDCHINIQDIDDLDSSLSMHMLTLKSPEWQYENEWRIFFQPHLESHGEQMPKPCAVYLGARMIPEQEREVYEICVEKNIPVYKMTPVLNKHILVPTSYVP